MVIEPVSRAHLSFLALTGVAVIFALPLALTESRSQTAEPPAQKGDTEAPTAQEASLKVEAPSVTVDGIVTDKKGHHVSGLAAEDFRVYEDNAPQKIVTFVPPVFEAAPPTEEPLPAGPTVKKGLDLARVRFITLVMELGDLQPASSVPRMQPSNTWKRMWPPKTTWPFTGLMKACTSLFPSPATSHRPPKGSANWEATCLRAASVSKPVRRRRGRSTTSSPRYTVSKLPPR